MSDPIDVINLQKSLLEALMSVNKVQERYREIRVSFGVLLEHQDVDSSVISPTSASGSLTPTGSDTEALSSEILGLQRAVTNIQDVPRENIFTVRKLHRILDGDAISVLTEYFGSKGQVEKIILLPSRRRCGRLRPSTTGFVIMKDPSAVQHIVATGVHLVAPNSIIEVTAFKFPTINPKPRV